MMSISLIGLLGAPVAGARALDPTLEDVYLYVFRDEVVPLS